MRNVNRMRYAVLVSPPYEPSVTGRRQRRPATEAEARVLASTVRTRILRLCLDESLTNKEIATRLGRDPATVLHHVRRLVDTGFLAALPARRGTRGAREVPYQATGKSWSLEMLGHQNAILSAFLEELEDAGGELPYSSRLGLRLTPTEREEFLDRIQLLLDEFADHDRDPDGEPWSVFFAMHRDTRGRPR